MQLSSSMLADARLQKNQFKFVKITCQHQKQSNSTCRDHLPGLILSNLLFFGDGGVLHANEGQWGLLIIHHHGKLASMATSGNICFDLHGFIYQK